ncbi:unnamed protein product [Staurois parvus]|uniref:Uncharacterized protein n=1 Tax=Staurois parvus TaxID=386267 RepID=A0ABN9AE79_9NEOB|nr:unnamed protein product [Staurois parvus]
MSSSQEMMWMCSDIRGSHFSPGEEPVHLCKTEVEEKIHLCKTEGEEPVHPVQD